MTDLQSFTLMMASAEVVETSVNTNNSPSQDYTTNPDDHSNHSIDSPGFKPFAVIYIVYMPYTEGCMYMVYIPVYSVYATHRGVHVSIVLYI